ncbi:RNA polymerase sigma factor [Pseudoxanthomonas sp. X-1]|uniref:RNA polymerase sigma factor n=1 Tax=Pseudoxanthomonas sp. X-1 TaxID=2571115 RepID=UPI00110A579E|nr:RNA polymerase sigma factor [Pseudoxanthomonas sp. X-1]TMN24197.1 RNA polymerase sigma factor [Pseudoxanthomonas sp. X-1]UAY75161.1 RNA polymerase sigma factor [Pseudoxanthomonas sp. X-1]
MIFTFWLQKRARRVEDGRAIRASDRAYMAHGQDSFLPLPPVLADEESCADARDFDAFMRQSRGALVKHLRAHLPSDADAQDAAQESLLRLLRYRGEAPGAWRPLLYRIATNVIGEFYRRRGTHRAAHHVPLDTVPLVSEAVEHEERIERSQRQALLRAAILALPARSRQIYLLSRVDGLSYAQIAARCGITVKAVEVSLSRALGAIAAHVGAGSGRAS